jgi:class 3 adenylate cyclase/tetratricopeptide (TPR) repeat protein
VLCPACASDNPDGQKFCGECGAPLSTSCPECGAACPPGQKFCGECGAALPAARVDRAKPAPQTPVSERRTASILFADLVGFTPISESRDPEEVRELLQRYFDVATTMVSRYGGTLEKFIGDAVMAVWGVPSAHDDDAERAVRAALDLVTAVAALGAEVGVPDLRVRAGVVTGEVAATIGAVGQGMVAGDSVNTAARIQALAPPGSVWVDTATRQATAAAVTYADAGQHPLKGKAEPAHLFAAQRVVAGIGGTRRIDGLEAPFTGRDRELLLVKELFHDCAEQRRARLVSVTGVPGAGKSRLSWEFFKYLDGVSGLALWHVGRCLSYGEGVAYWALAEIVRMRLGIAESDSADVAAQRLRAGLEEYVDDETDRSWLQPRLAILLGLDDDTVLTDVSRGDLFAAWRLFLERLSERAPVVIVLEDLQWADDGLLDFVDYLLDWCAGSPMFVLTLARPEINDRRPGWGSGRRNATSLSLEPLGEHAMRELVSGLVEGLPDQVRDDLAARADGIPLYAVETVRMLIDRDAVIPRAGRYRLADGAADSLRDLHVPVTLQALVAARIDGLTDAERRLVYDAAVLGQSFTREGLAAVQAATGSNGDVDALLGSLVRKEVLTLQADPRSPERGQYRFVQSVLRQVAYETLSRRDRKQRHLAVAEFLDHSDVDEFAAVVANHYLDAADAVPADADATDLRDAARRHLIAAADRAALLGATAEAAKYYAKALDLTTAPAETAYVTEQLGDAIQRGGNSAGALEHYARAHTIYESLGDDGSIARVAAAEGNALWLLGRIDDAVALMAPAYDATTHLGATTDRAELAAAIARCRTFQRDADEALRWCDEALTIAEHAGARPALVHALNQRANNLMKLARPVEALALLERSLDVVRSHPTDRIYTSTHNNLALYLSSRDPKLALDVALEGLDYFRRRGERNGELYLATQTMSIRMRAGEWDAVEALGAELLAGPAGSSRGDEIIRIPLRGLRMVRGDVEGLRALAVELPQLDLGGDDISMVRSMRDGMLAYAEGRVEEAARLLRSALVQTLDAFGPEDAIDLLPHPVSMLLEAGDVAGAEDVVGRLATWPVGARSPYLQAQLARQESLVAAARAQLANDDGFVEAEGLLGDLEMPYLLAEVQVEHASWLLDVGRADEAPELLQPAIATLERLQALPLLTRARSIAAGSTHGAPADIVR